LARGNSTMMALVGYKRPSQYDKDDAAFDVLQMVLGEGRTGLLYKELITDKRLAQSVQVGAAFPAGRYANLFLFVLVPAQGHTVDENEKALDEFLNRLKVQKLEATVLARAKAHARVTLINRLAGNAGIAALLGLFQADFGDWRKMFEAAESLNKVTADDVQRVVGRCFVPAGRTTAYTVTGQSGAVVVGGQE
jgi:zinc protease